MRDLLIAGLGDSVASGEGNPDRPITLTDDGFCFRRFLGTTRNEFFRPGRAGYKGNKSCDATAGAAADEWAKQGARWMSAPCHRSLYGYQVRTALESKGYSEVHDLEVEDCRYEVDAKNAAGEKVELELDLKTLAILDEDD